MQQLQIGDIVKVVRDETDELQDCVGKVVALDIEEDAIQKVNYTIGKPYISVAVVFGKADNTVFLEDFSGGDIGNGQWGAWFRREELRYSPSLTPSPIRCVPE